MKKSFNLIILNIIILINYCYGYDLSQEVWMEKIDSIAFGSTQSEVRKSLPPCSSITSILWAYSGIHEDHRKQLKVWAIDKQFAVIAAFDRSGEKKWIEDGRPLTRSPRHEDRMIFIVLVRHNQDINLEKSLRLDNLSIDL